MRTVTSRTSASVLLVLCLSLLTTACRADGNVLGIHLNLIDLLPGLTIHLYARDVPNARSLAMSPNGVLFVGTRSAGNVYAILAKNQDQFPAQSSIFISPVRRDHRCAPTGLLGLRFILGGRIRHCKT